jgi:hypothetical protein
MSTLICNGTGNLTGAATFAAAEAGALALVLNRNTTTAIAAATTVTSTTFTITSGKTVDAILLWLKCTAASPTGTFKVDLQKSGVSQGSVTVNKADLPDSTNAIPIPVLFKLSAGGAGTGTSVWTIVITTTGTGTVTAAIASATATNFTRACRTTTAATPAAADDLYIIGELTGAGTHTARTVTMDSTAATAYGNGAVNSTTVAGGGIHVAYYGTLSYGTSASTNYVLRVAGDLIVYQQGPFNIGASGAEIPRTSTAVLEFQPASADGDFGLRCLDNAVVNGFGLSRTSGKNIVKCKMTADAAASGVAPSTSTLSVDTDTGWLSGDIVAVASTTRTASDCEFGTLNADAGASSIVVKNMTVGAAGNAIPPTSNRGLLAAHSGTSPTQAEIGLLTRNVKIRSTSATLMTYVYCAALSTVNFSWVEMYYLGTNNANKRGLEVDAGATANAKSVTFCSIHDCDAQCVYFGNSTSLNVTFSNNVIWQSAAQIAVTLSGAIGSANYTFDANLLIKVGSIGFSLGDTAGTITNNIVAGAGSYGYDLEFNGIIGSFSGNTVHSSVRGLLIGTKMRGIIDGQTIYHSSATGTGIVFTSSWNHDLYFNNLTCFGNNGTNITAWDTINLTGSCIVAGDTTFASSNGILCGAAEGNNLMLSGVDMSGTTSIFAPHTLNDIAYNSTGTNITGVIKNCKVVAPVPDNSWSLTAYLSFEKYNQTSGDHRTVMMTGTLKTDTSIFNTASPSMRMTPSSLSSATWKLESAPKGGKGLLVAVANGGTVNISVWIYKSKTGDGAAYNGSQPRLIQRANPALGQNSDVVLATYSAGTGSWNQLTATSSTATDDGAFEFIVDCDGSAGWINVDDWAAA